MARILTHQRFSPPSPPLGARAALNGDRRRGALVGRRGLGLGLTMSPRKRSAITFSDLTLGYDRHPAVHHITGEVRRGDLLAFIGPNGAGKSTLLKGIIGELKPLSGSLELDGPSRHEIAYLPQQIEIDRSFPISVFDCVALGLWREIRAWRGVDRAGKTRVVRALATVGLQDLGDRPVGSLSGGQFQRVLFARLLLQDAAIILLDEPFRAVDSKTVDDLIALILRWHAEGRTVVAALHDLEQVRSFFPLAMVLARELVAWGDSSAVLTPDILKRARALCEAWDEDAAVCGRGEHEAQRKTA
jgi:zinc/manganese transport system ATP-binding protein